MARESVPDLSLIAAPAWRQAERRAAVIRPLAALPACPREEARAAAEALGLSERQVYRLLRRCREDGGALDFRWWRADRAAAAAGRGSGRRATGRSRDVVAELYLTPQRLSGERIIREVRRRAFELKLRPPAASTVRRRIAALSLEERCRRGDVEPPVPVGGATPPARSPLDVVQIDHTPVDLILVDPTERQPIGRSWITVAIDVFSGSHRGVPRHPRAALGHQRRPVPSPCRRRQGALAAGDRRRGRLAGDGAAPAARRRQRPRVPLRCLRARLRPARHRHRLAPARPPVRPAASSGG